MNKLLDILIFLFLNYGVYRLCLREVSLSERLRRTMLLFAAAYMASLAYTLFCKGDMIPGTTFLLLLLMSWGILLCDLLHSAVLQLMKLIWKNNKRVLDILGLVGSKMIVVPVIAAVITMVQAAIISGGLRV